MNTQQIFDTQGWTTRQLPDLGGKTYLITGANTGTGFQAARLFLSKGAKVVMLNRNTEKSIAAISDLKGEFGEDADVSFIKMDLAVLTSVREAAHQILTTLYRIDALICNAAIAQVAKRELTVDGAESQLGVNHLGHFLLCGLLFKQIETVNGRIVVVGSNAYKIGLQKIHFTDLNFDKKYTAWNAYAQSKLAQMMFAYQLQKRIAAANKTVKVYVCHPGASRTNLLKDTASGFNKALWWVLSKLIAQSAEQGALPQVMCATQPGLPQKALYGPTKRADTVGPVGKCQLHAVALDEDMAQRLWAVSESQTAFIWAL